MNWHLSPRLAGIFAIAVMFLFTGKVEAQTYEEALIRDLGQTIKARLVLQDDPQLGSLNLGVKVTNRVAVLWGPVPSPDLSLRAEQRLRGMFELVDVRNNLSIETDNQAAPLVSPVPNGPRFLPDQVPASAPGEQRRPVPLVAPDKGVSLAGIVPSTETRTAHSSPLGTTSPVDFSRLTLHMPFLGSITLPR
jgi:BON domain